MNYLEMFWGLKFKNVRSSEKTQKLNKNTGKFLATIKILKSF